MIRSTVGPVIGTWTPSLKFGATTVAGTSVGGHWIKNGQKVWIEADITLTAKNGTGTATIVTLPFPCLVDTGGGFFFVPVVSGMVAPSGLIGYQCGVNSNSASTTIQMTKLVIAAGLLTEVLLDDTDFNTTSYFKCSGEYMTSS